MRCQSDSACRARAVAASQLLARGFLGQSVVDIVEHGEHVARAHGLSDVHSDAK